MSHILRFFLITSLFITFTNVYSQTTERINFKWLYTKGDPHGAEQPGFDDKDWEIIKLPHDGSIYEKGQGTVGWYRKHIELFGNLNQRKIYIGVEGVSTRYNFWINGQQLGEQVNGLIPSVFDVSPYMLAGENVIAVRYEKESEGDKQNSGEGLIKDVWVHFNNELHIAHDGFKIEFPLVSENKASVKIDTDIINYRKDSTLCKLLVSVTDQTGTKSFQKIDSIMLGPGDKNRFEHELEIKDPHLWSLENPYLYSVAIKLSDARGVVDVHEHKFGIRQLETHPNGELFLNGEGISVRCIRFNQDFGPLGAAVHKRAVERRIKSIKSLGFNTIQLNTQMQSKQILELCDEYGLLVLNEGENYPDLAEFLDPCGFWTANEQPAGKPSRIILEPDRKYIAADGFDLCFITVRVVDKKGRTVQDAAHLISFKVSGAADNAGVGNGDTSSTEPWQASKRSAYKGKALLILRSNQKKGEIEIKARAKGLKPAELIIQAI